jgi:repressor LexA
MKLTEREAEILTFIITFINTNGYAPTFREIGQALYYAGTFAVQRHVTNLITKGYVSHVPKKQRTLKPIKEVAI